MRTLKLALLASALAATPAVASAQEVGATIYGNDGNPVGTVTEVTDQVIVVDTGKHKAPVPANTIFDGEKGKSVNATKEQVDTMMDQQVAPANAKRDAALVEGTAVVTANGNPVGSLGAVDLTADKIMLQSPQGPLMLKKEHFAIDGQGRLAVLYSREQIATAASGGTSATTSGGAK